MPDRSFDLLTEAILERDQPRTADLFFQMVARDGRSLPDALGVVTAAEAPFVRLLAGWLKMPGERECYARFVKEWMN